MTSPSLSRRRGRKAWTRCSLSRASNWKPTSQPGELAGRGERESEVQVPRFAQKRSARDDKKCGLALSEAEGSLVTEFTLSAGEGLLGMTIWRGRVAVSPPNSPANPGL